MEDLKKERLGFLNSRALILCPALKIYTDLDLTDEEDVSERYCALKVS